MAFGGNNENGDDIRNIVGGCYEKRDRMIEQDYGD